MDDTISVTDNKYDIRIEYHEDCIHVIYPRSIGDIFFPPVIKKYYKLSEIPEDLYESLTEEEINTVYYFFFDLETNYV